MRERERETINLFNKKKVNTRGLRELKIEREGERERDSERERDIEIKIKRESEK